MKTLLSIRLGLFIAFLALCLPQIALTQPPPDGFDAPIKLGSDADVKPDPSKPADASLKTISLPEPGYRPPITTAKTGVPPTEGELAEATTASSSSTIMGMAGEEGTTTAAPAEEAAVTPKGEAAKLAGTSKASEGEEKKAEEGKEAEATSTMEPTTTAAEATTTPPLEAGEPLPEPEESTTTEPIQITSDEKVNELMKALSAAIESNKLLVQNITISLPNYNPQMPPNVLYDLLVGSRTGIGGGPNQLVGAGNKQLFDASGAVNKNIYGPIVPQPKPIGPVIAEWHPIIDVDMLAAKLQSSKTLKLLDASYEPEPTLLDPPAFKEKYYGKWEDLMKDKKGLQYSRSHIPGAINFNLNVATYPTWNEQQALYPEELFQEYVRKLGINANDEIVVYARGPLGGMLHAARVWEMFRIYGHERVSVLNGGLDAWRRAQLPTDGEEVTSTTEGNWKARMNPQLLVTYDELVANQADGYCVMNKLNWYNFFDARPRIEFLGLIPALYSIPPRNRIIGSRSFPADELIRPDGLFAQSQEIGIKLHTVGYNPNFETIVLGTTAAEASMVILALKVLGESRARLYNGGLDEIRRRGPHFIAPGGRLRKAAAKRLY